MGVIDILCLGAGLFYEVRCLDGFDGQVFREGRPGGIQVVGRRVVISSAVSRGYVSQAGPGAEKTASRPAQAGNGARRGQCTEMPAKHAEQGPERGLAGRGHGGVASQGYEKNRSASSQQARGFRPSGSLVCCHRTFSSASQSRSSAPAARCRTGEKRPEAPTFRNAARA